MLEDNKTRAKELAQEVYNRIPDKIGHLDVEGLLKRDKPWSVEELHFAIELCRYVFGHVYMFGR